MSTTARRRLIRDLRKLQSDSPVGVTAAPMGSSNLMVWEAVIFGPDDTDWEGGTFRLTMTFSEEYPGKPPVVRFVTKMFHPNIYANGSICLDILQNQWSPMYTPSMLLTSIQSLLCDPNPNSPANSEAASLYESDKAEYSRRVRLVVERSWIYEGDEDGEDAAVEAEEVLQTPIFPWGRANNESSGSGVMPHTGDVQLIGNGVERSNNDSTSSRFGDECLAQYFNSLDFRVDEDVREHARLVAQAAESGGGSGRICGNGDINEPDETDVVTMVVKEGGVESGGGGPGKGDGNKPRARLKRGEDESLVYR